MIIMNVYTIILDPIKEKDIINRLELDSLEEGWKKIYESETYVTFELRKSCEIPSILFEEEGENDGDENRHES